MLRFSIVTSSFNQVRYLEDCLLSVKQQGYSDMEHIVVDGGSADGSVELLRDYSARAGWGHLRWISERDNGQSHALNKGFRMATGDVIGWLNSDDFYLEDCLHKVAKKFSDSDVPDVVYGDYVWTDDHRRITQVRREIAFSRFVLLHNHVTYIHSSGALFFKRHIVEAGHRLNEQYHYSMDYEFYLRLAEAGYRFTHLPALLSGFRWHGKSKSVASASRQTSEYESARRSHLIKHGQLDSVDERSLRLVLLRTLANCRRWGEKALRGCYFPSVKSGARLTFPRKTDG
jgi:GT2 family glycosyltransferase